MMRQMRENTKWIMLITATAFVGLMVFQWGMDITGRSGLSIGEIGSVNGTPVMYNSFNQTYRSLFDQVQASQEDPITSQQIRDLEDAAWDEVVNQVLIQQELRRRGIVVTDEELLTAARFNPPPEFQNSPAFQTDGLFDIQKYQPELVCIEAYRPDRPRMNAWFEERGYKRIDRYLKHDHINWYYTPADNPALLIE